MKDLEINIPLQDGQSGDWLVKHFEVDKKNADQFNFHNAIRGSSRFVVPGNYIMLKCGDETVMSNTPAEIDDHRIFFNEVIAGVDNSRVLINGLGLGMCIFALLPYSKVEHITVVEISEDVIKLVEPYIGSKRVEIIHADALEYKPPKGILYDYVWHDIWTTLCSDNLEEMSKLKRKYKKICRWQGCWCEWECKRLRRGYRIG